ncbi:hypothetical protein ACFE04_031100 [Oxalis oulophora]
MQSAKEAIANVAASAKSGMEKTKATAQEKVDKMTAHDPIQKDMATQKKQERVTQAELDKQEARQHNAVAKQAGQMGGHPEYTTTGTGAYTAPGTGGTGFNTTETHSYSTTGAHGQPTGAHQMSAMPGHGTGQPAGGHVTEGVIGSHPIGMNTETGRTTGRNPPLGGARGGLGTTDRDSTYRLPEAKHVFRCKLVCRNWNRIISTHFAISFINHHQNITHPNKISRFVPTFTKIEGHTIRSLRHLKVKADDKYNYDFLAFLATKGNVDIDDDGVRVLGSCNDLVLCRLSQTKYCVYNPTTKQYVILPPFDPIDVINIVGFVCDDDDSYAGQGNYRVVFATTYAEPEFRIHEFSSRSKEWRKICILDVPGVDKYQPVGSVNKMLRNIEPPVWEEDDFGQRRNISYQVCQGSLRLFQLNCHIQGRQVNIIAKVWELKDFNYDSDVGGEWNVMHKVCLRRQLFHLWPSVVKKVVRKAGGFMPNKLMLLEIDPNDIDIIYIGVGNAKGIVSCNLREMEMKWFQSDPFTPWFYTVFPEIISGDFDSGDGAQICSQNSLSYRHLVGKAEFWVPNGGPDQAACCFSLHVSL